MLKPTRKHHFHVSTRTPKSLQSDLQKGALGSQFGTQNGKSALQEVIKKTSKKYIGKYPKIAKKLPQNGHAPLSFLGTFLIIFGSWFLGVPQHQKIMFFAKNHCFLCKNAVVLANRCMQHYTHGLPSPHKLARRYTGLPAQ